MCHLILALPFVALPVLWLLPAGEGIAVYAVALAVTGAVYWLAVKAMRTPVQIGTETLLHAVGTVRAVDGRKGAIWVASELWSAEFAEGVPAVGDAVEVVGIDGLRLVVRKVVPARAASLQSQPVH
jgi:membrane-bound ClpP family serine protease